MLGHRFRVLAGSLVAGVVLFAATGCGDDPRPKIDPDASVTWTPYSGEPSEPESSDSTTSAAADPLTPVQTVRAWVEAYNEVKRTGDAAPARALATPKCWTCEEFVGSAEEVALAGGSYKNGSWMIRKIRAVPGRTGMVAVSIDATAGVVTERDGAKPRQFDADVLILTVSLRRLNGEWRVGKLVFLS